MKKAKFFLLLAAAIPAMLRAQCPASVTITSVDVVNADCPSNGKATVNSNGGGTNAVQYQLTQGPQGGGWPTGQQDSPEFTALPPGDYTVKAICKDDLNISSTKNFTIGKNYVNLAVTVTTTGVCTNFVPGGKITVNTSGGKAPLEYAILKSANGSEPVENFTFGSSNTFDLVGADPWGTYQVRVRDACGNIVPQTVELIPNTPKAKITQVIPQILQGQVNALFGGASVNCGKVITVFRLADYLQGTPVTPSATTQYRIAVWESSTTTPPAISGTPAWEKDFKSTNDLTGIPLTIGTRSIAWKITTGCGEETTGNVQVPDLQLSLSPKAYPACGASGVSIATQTNTSAWPLTLEVTGYAANNSIVVPTITRTVNNALQLLVTGIGAADHYTVKITDACGSTASKSILVEAGTPSLLFSYMGDCTSVIGTGRVLFSFGSVSGNVPGWGTGAPGNMRIVNTVTNQEWTPDPNITWANSMSFPNIPPGDNYVLRFTSANGCTTDIPFKVTPNSAAPLSDFTLGGTSTQTCDGTGTITSTIATNYTVPVIYKLYKDGGSSPTATNGTGTFVGLAAGTYKVVAELAMCFTLPPLTSTKEYTIKPAGQNPVIEKKIGIVCDNSNTGLAGLAFTGTGPFKLEQKLSTDPESAFTTINASAPNELLVTGLTPNATYDFRITDQCSKTAITTVTIAPLTKINRVTTQQPCINQPYVLELEKIPGATYSWKREDGAQISTSNKLEWSSYQANNDGMYTCTVTINNCITRTETVTVNSTYCGSPLLVSFGNISAILKGDHLQVNWTSLTEKDNAWFEIEASSDGAHFHKIGEIKSRAETGNSGVAQDYSFEILAAQAMGTMGVVASIFLLGVSAIRRKLMVSGIAIVLLATSIIACNKATDLPVTTSDGNLYIRIVTVDKDGNRAYSKVIKVVKE
ncbi:hypothetical protein LL912_24710 [Niabella sp. CC-SYL272]|uniref:hypothetical protein n=1 Tax=Niabella agricola TaxID=2891571 RepID=UPI001F1DF33F|nr:hypothetical protein [Niabella agricola]MCF3112013.1 hypothetical protein [Niabella agricola]